jgi:hypothetical protein
VGETALLGGGAPLKDHNEDSDSSSDVLSNNPDDLLFAKLDSPGEPAKKKARVV